MSVGFKVTISERGMELIARYGDIPAMLNAVRIRLDLETELALGYIKENHLTGPRSTPWPPSEHRLRRGKSGKLSESARRTDAVIVGNKVISKVGSRVKYAILHEEGWYGYVPPHTRESRGESLLLGPQKLTKAGKPRKKVITATPRGRDIFVGGHYRNIPRRAPFFYGMMHEVPVVTEGISEAIVNYYEGEQ